MQQHLENQLINAFPNYLKDKVIKVISNLTDDTSYYHEYVEAFIIDNELVEIPYRFYFKNTEIKLDNLDELEKVILYCIFSRDNDGYVREKYIQKLIELDKIYDFVIPFLFIITGEYVVEIIEISLLGIKKIEKSILEKFIEKNSEKIKLIEERMISYWSEYYRRKSFGITFRPEYKDWSNYPAHFVLDHIKKHGYKTNR